MKIRTGFVSNSSSSSFVILGVSTSEIDSLRDKDYDELHEFRDKHSVELHSLDSMYLIGKSLADIDESGYVSEEQISLDDLNKYADELAALLQIPRHYIKIYTGTEVC